MPSRCSLPAPPEFSICVTVTSSRPVGPTDQNRTLDTLLHYWADSLDGADSLKLLNSITEALRDKGGRFMPISTSSDSELAAMGKDRQLALPIGEESQ